MTPDQKKQVVRDVYAAIDAENLDALRPHPGLHETIRAMPHLWASITDLRTTIDHITVDGDMVATVSTVTGSHIGSFIGEPASGGPVSFMLVGMHRVVDGKITLHFALPDLFPFLAMTTAPAEPALAMAPS